MSLALALLVGASLASQAGVNAQLRLALGSPLQAAFISFLVGTIILGTIVALRSEPWFSRESLAATPWWAWLGGALGAFNIALAIYLAPKLGALLLAVATVSGQLMASLVLDHNGWLGYPRIELTLTRAAGAVLIVVGLLLVARQ